MSKAVVAVLQVIVGLAVVMAVYLLSLKLMQQDKLVIDVRSMQNSKTETKIIPGFVDSTVIANRSFNTIMPMSDNFVNMPKSFNRQGGAQYSFSFWIFVDDPEQAVNKTILLRGDNRTYNSAVFIGDNADFVTSDVNSGKTDVSTGDAKRTGMWFPTSPDMVVSYPMLASPCITFGSRYDQIAILFNTVDWPFGMVTINPRRNTQDDTKRRDAMKLIAHKWALFTFVLEDNVANNDFEDGIVVRFYLNDMLYHTERVAGSLRSNNGNLYLFPDGGIPQTRIADLTYFNYALGQDRIKHIYEQGVPTYYYSDMISKAGFGTPLYLSEYNKLDIYNA